MLCGYAFTNNYGREHLGLIPIPCKTEGDGRSCRGKVVLAFTVIDRRLVLQLNAEVHTGDLDAFDAPFHVVPRDGEPGPDRLPDVDVGNRRDRRGAVHEGIVGGVRVYLLPVPPDMSVVLIRDRPVPVSDSARDSEMIHSG